MQQKVDRKIKKFNPDKECVESGCKTKLKECDNLKYSNFCCYHISSTPNVFWCPKCKRRVVY